MIGDFGVYQELRQDPITAIIPSIFLTAKAAPADLRAGMALGADDYLTNQFRVIVLHGPGREPLVLKALRAGAWEHLGRQNARPL